MPPTTEQVTAATKQLDDAVVEYMRSVHETPIVVDWYIVADVHHEEHGRQIKVAESASMTPWNREGVLRFIARAFGITS